MTLKNWSYALLATYALAGWSSVGIAQISVDVSVNVPPPELPVYDQPPIPGDGYVWTPGYWAWGDDLQDYYWVPGTWVEAPQPEYLWTPGYWAAEEGVFLFHPGYWGPQVGFYGGVNYGYGYTGNGYQGGYWRDGRMYYNRSVVNVGSAHITNVYNRTVINNVTINRVSYNGGRGGIDARPNSEQQAAARERHVDYTTAQRQHQQEASRTPGLRLSENRGAPSIAATPRPAAFSGSGVVAARHGAPAATRVNPAQQQQPQPQQREMQQQHEMQQQREMPQQREMQPQREMQRAPNAPAAREPAERESTQAPRPAAPAPREQRMAPSPAPNMAPAPQRPEARTVPPAQQRENVPSRPVQQQPQQQPREQPRAPEQRPPPARPEPHPPERPRTPER